MANHKEFQITGSDDNFSFAVTEQLTDKKVTYLWENLTEQELKDVAYPYVTNFYDKVGKAKSILPEREQERDQLITALQGSLASYDYRATYSAANNIEGTYVMNDNGVETTYQFVDGDVIQAGGEDVGNYRLLAPNYIAVQIGEGGYQNFFSNDTVTFTNLDTKTLTKQ